MSIEVPDELHRRAKAAAQQSDVSLREYVIAALELATKASNADRRHDSLLNATRPSTCQPVGAFI